MFTPEDVPTETENAGPNETTGLATAEEKSSSIDPTKMGSWAQEGPLTFKVLCLIGGVCMTVSGVLGLFGVLFSPLHAVIEGYMCIFGVMIIMMEGSKYLCPINLKETVLREAKFLAVLNGRGAFYVFLGTLLLTQWPNFFDVLIGIYMVLLGFVMVIIGTVAKAKLNAMAGHLTDENSVNEAFKAVDVDNNGALNYDELAVLCQNLGSKLTKEELAACIQDLDKDGSGVVEYTEFFDWWKKTAPAPSDVELV